MCMHQRAGVAQKEFLRPSTRAFEQWLRSPVAAAILYRAVLRSSTRAQPPRHRGRIRLRPYEYVCTCVMCFLFFSLSASAGAHPTGARTGERQRHRHRGPSGGCVVRVPPPVLPCGSIMRCAHALRASVPCEVARSWGVCSRSLSRSWAYTVSLYGVARGRCLS